MIHAYPGEGPMEPISENARNIVLEDACDRLFSSLRLAVVFGGDKSMPGSVVYQTGNSRSWKSYEAVANDIHDSLRSIGFRHVELMADDLHFPDRLRRSNIHMAWLNTAGVQGYNPAAHAVSILELAGIPYLGHCPLTVSMLDNKHVFKSEAVCAGLPTARFSVWDMTRGPFRPAINSRFQRMFAGYDGAFVVKPVSGRASLHVHVVDSPTELPEAVEDVYRHTKNLVLIEEYLAGREFCVAVSPQVISVRRRLFTRGSPFAFAPIERVFDSDERIFTSMDFRPITAERFRVLDATEADLVERLYRLAAELFLEFNLNFITRIDLRAGLDGELRILEANPKPDLKRPKDGVTNLISDGLTEHGMDYDDLIFSLFASRLDFLLEHRASSITHIAELLGQGAASGAAPAGTASTALADVNETITNASVSALRHALETAGPENSGGIGRAPGRRIKQSVRNG